ncbi:hypothetical protein MEQU1_002475 [Malassezia equina]|uniref:Vta1 C-terminal domain-containing protein n=1 Tax=Malassezia equina TaxID=1381935 RepID=A0AAF0IZC2_9BASI|nr:hypothetical protein MEQU1_002475 [Malassezia equina]
MSFRVPAVLKEIAPFLQRAKEMQTKIKYAKWKAAQISKALREGTALVPGPDAVAEKTEPQPTRPAPDAHVGTDQSASLQLPQVPQDTDTPQVTVMHARSEELKPTPSARPTEAFPSAASFQSTDATTSSVTESGMSVSEIAHIQKLCRWASSALDYEDLETARTQLREALALLDGAGTRT